MNQLSLDDSDRDAYYLLTGICIPSLENVLSTLNGNPDSYITRRVRDDCHKALCLLQKISSTFCDEGKLPHLIDLFRKPTVTHIAPVPRSIAAKYVETVLVTLNIAANVCNNNLSLEGTTMFAPFYRNLMSRKSFVLGNMFDSDGEISDLAEYVLSRGQVLYYSIQPPKLLVCGNMKETDMKLHVDGFDPSLWKHIVYDAKPGTIITIEEQ